MSGLSRENVTGRAVGALLLSLGASALLATTAASETAYQENYEGETAFPMTPEIDLLGLGLFNAGSSGQGPPHSPTPTGSAALAVSLSTGGGLPDEIAGAGANADPLLALATAFSATGRYEDFHVSASRSDPNGVLGVGFAATALYDVAGGYAVSASVFSVDAGGASVPTLNIAELDADVILGLETIQLPAPFDSAGFDLELEVDPVAGTAIARATSGGQTFETTPITLTSYGGRQSMTLGQLLGAANQYGPGDTASAEFADFWIATAATVQAEIDVSPRDRGNVIDPRRELTSVAIFSASDFDATTIVPSSISLGGAPVGVSPWTGELCRVALVNRDPQADLLCKVVTALIDVPIGKSIVTLEATTADGTRVEGHDRVRRPR